MATVLNAQTEIDTVETGITPRDTKGLAGALSKALADSFTLYVKTLGVHWNAVGPVFYSLHKLTETQYEDLQDAIDSIAERIRSIGYPAPAGFEDFKRMSTINCAETLNETDAMIQELVSDNEAIAKRLRAFVAIAEHGEDVFTADLLTARIGRHEENAWMLRSLMA